MKVTLIHNPDAGMGGRVTAGQLLRPLATPVTPQDISPQRSRIGTGHSMRPPISSLSQAEMGS